MASGLYITKKMILLKLMKTIIAIFGALSIDVLPEQLVLSTGAFCLFVPKLDRVVAQHSDPSSSVLISVNCQTRK